MVSQDEAERIAAKELRFEIGNLPHLSDPKYVDEKGYVFEIRFTKPELPTREEIDDPEIDQSVDYYETRTIGEMVVTDEGDIERTSNDELSEEIQRLDELAEQGELPKYDADDEG